MNYWKYEPSPAEVSSWECINLIRQQTDIVRLSLAQRTSNTRDLCICLSWSSSRIPTQDLFRSLQFRLDWLSIWLGGGCERLLVIINFIVLNQLRWSSDARPDQSTERVKFSHYNRLSWLNATNRRLTAPVYKVAGCHYTICTVTNLNFPPLTSPSYKITLISRQVSRAAQTVTTNITDCPVPTLLLSSLYHNRVGEGGREGGRDYQ